MCLGLLSLGKKLALFCEINLCFLALATSVCSHGQIGFVRQNRNSSRRQGLHGIESDGIATSGGLGAGDFLSIAWRRVPHRSARISAAATLRGHVLDPLR